MIARYRKSPLQVLVPYVVLGLPIFIAFGAVAIFEPSARQAVGEVIRPVIGIFAGCGVWLIIFDRGQYCALAPDGVTVHGVRRKVIRWSEVASIDVETVMYTRIIVLVMTDRKRVRLPAPASLLDRRFDEKLQFIRETHARAVR
jgi:hypothetical protein